MSAETAPAPSEAQQRAVAIARNNPACPYRALAVWADCTHAEALAALRGLGLMPDGDSDRPCPKLDAAVAALRANPRRTTREIAETIGCHGSIVAKARRKLGLGKSRPSPRRKARAEEVQCRA
jgi:hypothetical protein